MIADLTLSDGIFSSFLKSRLAKGPFKYYVCMFLPFLDPPTLSADVSISSYQQFPIPTETTTTLKLRAVYWSTIQF